MRKIIIERSPGSTDPQDLLVTIYKDDDETQLTYSQYLDVCTFLTITPLPSLSDLELEVPGVTVTSYRMSDEYFYPSYVATLVNDVVGYQDIAVYSLVMANATTSIDNLEEFSYRSGEWGAIFYPISPPP